MNKNLLSIALAFSALGDLSSPLDTNSKTSINDIDFTPKKAPLPKGCKEYFFNSLGDFINYNDGVYTFKCVAISDKSAIKKFNKWVTNQVAQNKY
jgi:hypothetical protein